jgi:hypothetical protein
MRIIRQLALLTLATSAEAQTLVIKAVPAAAAIYRVKPGDGSLLPLGTGSAEFKLLDKDPNTVVVRLEGYRDSTASWAKGTKFKDKTVTIALTTRVVKLSVAPPSAAIYLHGESLGTRAAALEVQPGKPAAVEVKLAGYSPVSRTYELKDGAELPLSDRIELVDRVVLVSTEPAGGELLRDGTSLGDKPAGVAVPLGACVIVRAQKPGWASAERSYCNKEGLSPPPLEDKLVFAGRRVNVVAPAEAKILVNQKEVGVGTAAVGIPAGTCVQVRVEQTAFLPVTREYCARDNAAAAPADDAIMLNPDESFAASAPSDSVNQNLTIDVAATRTEEQAWRLLSSVVLSRFDVLENADRETGYLRTAWQSKSFSDGAVVIRTRVIIKRTGSDPLRYTVKLSSERSRGPGAAVKDDESFLPWDRVLTSYQGLVGELQAKLP